MRYEILIGPGDWYGRSPNVYLDTFEDVSISLNYNIADISDISAKKSSYSKTIDLPDTENNRKVFSNIFDMDLDLNNPLYTSTFNPNKKVKCWVLRDGLTQFEGNLQMTNINYNFDKNSHIYQVVIYSDNDNLFKNIGEKYLSDLNLSAYDHSWNYENVVGSWTASWINGYYYPLIDYGFPLNLGKLQDPFNRSTQFYPAIYLKTLINQIFAEAGYTYNSDFFNSSFFENLIIPFNNKNLIPSSGIITNQNIISKGGLVNDVDISNSNMGNVDWGCITWDKEIYDPNGFFDPTTSAYKYIGTQSITQRFTIKFNFRISPGNVTTNEAPWQSWSDNIRLYVVRSKDANGNNVPNWSTTPGYYDFINWPTITFGGQQRVQLRSGIDAPYPGWGKYQIPNSSDWIAYGQVTTDYISPPLRNGEEVRFFITRSINNQAANPKTQFISYPIDDPPFFQAEIDPSQASQFTLLEMKNLVPSNVKQKDILISVFKLFNLYIEPSKNDINSFIIEPKDDYFEKFQTIKDWSQKLDLNQDISSEILSNTQDRTYLFTYKSDKDFYNAKYTEVNNEIFGEYKYDIDNDFLANEKKIEVIFSPTPLNKLPGSSNIYLPSIFQSNNGAVTRLEGMNIRLLYKSPKLLQPGEYIKVDGTELNIYPYAGYVDDPKNPQVSLNFGQVESFYTGYTETNNNLIYNYYLNTLLEVSDKNSRKITANLYLTSKDINQFRFSDLIYLDFNNMVGYYRVNKIIDYDPSKFTTTKVELLKAYNYELNFSASQSINPNTCIVKFATNFQDYFSTILDTLRTNAPSYLTFWNTYTNIAYSYPTASVTDELLSINDIVSWSNSQPAPIPGFSMEIDELENIIIYWKVEIVQGSNVSMVISATPNINDLTNKIDLYQSPGTLECPQLRQSNYIPQSGRRIAPPQDVVMVGNISSDSTNVFTDINNIVSGPNNIVTGYNNIISGDSNAVGGNSNFVNGNNNSSISSNTFIIGSSVSNNYVSNKPSILIGTNIDNYTEGSFLFGENISIGGGTESFTITNTFSAAGTPSNGLFIFGNNVEITQPSNASFIVGDNIVITQSTPGSLFYVGTDTIEITTQNFITNVIGTSSFNKMTIADLNIKDELNYNPNFRFDQYNPGDYPNGSYFYFNSPIPDLELIYQNLDGSYLTIVNNVNNISNSEIKFGAGNIYLKGVDVTEQKTIRSDLNLYYEFGITYGTTTSQISAGYDRIFEDNTSGLISTERNQHFLNITTTSSVVQNYNLVSTNASFMTIEANIIGNDDPNFYFSKKIASFANGNQIGTTTTIYENTNFGTWSVDLNLDGLYANLAVSGGTTQSVTWKLYTKIYLH